MKPNVDLQIAAVSTTNGPKPNAMNNGTSEKKKRIIIVIIKIKIQLHDAIMGWMHVTTLFGTVGMASPELGSFSIH